MEQARDLLADKELTPELLKRAFKLLKTPHLVRGHAWFGQTRNLRVLRGQSGVYGWYNRAEHRLYIGSSTDLRARLYRHYKGSPRHTNAALQASVKAYGWDAFTLVIFQLGPLPDAVTREAMILLEDWYLAHFPTSHKYNVLEKAFSRIGAKHTQESKDKMSQALRDRSLTEEHRRKISEGGRGLKRSQETRQRISDAQKGVTKSAAARTILSLSRLGISSETPKVFVVTDNVTQETWTFESLAACERGLGKSGNWARRRFNGITRDPSYSIVLRDAGSVPQPEPESREEPSVPQPEPESREEPSQTP
jgi:group I intron endonuclease